MAKPLVSFEDIPQANDLTKVGMVAVAVSKGKDTYQTIAKFIGFTDRQGRYYRRAAEILGLIVLGSRNSSKLTESGKKFVIDVEKNRDILLSIRPHLLSIPLIREVYERVANTSEVDESDILEILIELSGVRKNNVTIVRRLSTFVSWLKQAKLLESVEEEEKTFRLLPAIFGIETKVSDSESNFIANILPYLHIPKKAEDINWEQLFSEYLKLKTTKEKTDWLKAENHQRLARYVIGISSKEKIDLEKLDYHAKVLSEVELSHARLLIERSRSLRFITKSISTAGTKLEAIIGDWLKANGKEFLKAHLLEGSNKNVDFYVDSLKLAIESKFSKGAGTKHRGAVSDLNEIAKAKKFAKDLLVGVVLGGEGFEESFFSALEDSYDKKNLDFIIPVGQIDGLSPDSIKRMTKFTSPNIEQLKLQTSVEMNWSEQNNEFESGLYDSIFWLKKYSTVSYLSFKARLQTWINQTPFAIECMRLVLGWSETQMYNFVLNAVPTGIDMLKTGNVQPEQVSLLVSGMSKHINPTELAELENFFEFSPTISDFIEARIEAFDGVARRKHDTSKIFTGLCKEACRHEITTTHGDIALTSTVKLKANFSFKDASGKTKLVHCRYNSSDGSVMSDLVKILEVLGGTNQAKDWVLIVDGAGWKKRMMDLKRLLEVTRSNSLELHTLKSWTMMNQKTKLQA